jgi:tRNA-Thr(GGU) m(6)t(6)A37 methyltransferase TsaA
MSVAASLETSPELAPLIVKPIGIVRNEIREPEYIEWGEVCSRLEIAEEWRGALQTVESYSHLMVLFWMHQVESCKIVHVPQGRYRDVPAVGMFACRCPYRPNPIAVSVVRLRAVREGEIDVIGLDAIDGTPILDIKPYTPVLDEAKGEVRVPDWVHKLTY